MTLPDVHLAGEAVAALVDGELAHFARERALAHLAVCAECRGAVRAQREAAALLGRAPDPVPPASLMARLREVPMTTELGGPPDDAVVALDGEDLVWATPSSMRGETPTPPPLRPRPNGAEVPPAPVRPPSRRAPSGPARGSRPPGRPHRVHRVRRVLVGAMAGLAFGLFASAAPNATAGAGFPEHDVAPDTPTQRGNPASIPQVSTVQAPAERSGLTVARDPGPVRQVPLAGLTGQHRSNRVTMR